MSAVASLVAAGRRAAEALMVDTIVVYDVGDRDTQDESTGDEVLELVIAFTSKAKFQQGDVTQPNMPSVGGRREAIDETTVQIPVSAPQVVQGQVVECTAVGDGSDPRLVGRKWVVSVPMNKTYSTATRLSLRQLP